MLLGIMAMLLLAGCQSSVTGQVTADTKDTVHQTIETDNGTVQISATEGQNDSWCQTGAQWSMNAPSQGQDAQWTIDKLETSGEYKGLCHVIYTANTPDGKMRMDYYFDESGDNGYYEMNIGGKTIKQEWHA